MNASPFSRSRSFVLSMLFLSHVILYLDRAALSINATHMQAEFGLTSVQLGMLFSIFSIGYVVFNMVGGLLADKFGPKNVLLSCMVVWSLFTGSMALAVSFLSLIAIRLFFGMSEGPCTTSVNKTVDLWYPPDKKASAMGISASGSPLGAALAGPIVGFITLKYNWRTSFVIIMFIGFIWAFFWWKYMDKRKTKQTKSESEINTCSTKSPYKLKLFFYLKQKTIIASAVAFFSYNYILFFFINWFPSYLIKMRAFALYDVSIINILPWTLGFVALASGGIVSDFVRRKLNANKDPLLARRVVLGFGLLFSAIAVFVADIVSSNVLTIALVSTSIFFLYLTGSIYWGIVNDIVDSSNVGSVGGIMHGCGNCGGLLAPFITGCFIHLTNDFSTAFTVAGIIGSIGAVLSLLFIRKVDWDSERIKKYIVAS
ncbi:MAG: MFS transporter [Endomicrobium sp.]|jgi:ACS family hexuronate transporter-like MFS transporter|nr:MFS transporter [Endomicrobium sp.]